MFCCFSWEKSTKCSQNPGLVNEFSATPRGQLNWTGPIANSSYFLLFIFFFFILLFIFSIFFLHVSSVCFFFSSSLALSIYLYLLPFSPSLSLLSSISSITTYFFIVFFISFHSLPLLIFPHSLSLTIPLSSSHCFLLFSLFFLLSSSFI